MTIVGSVTAMDDAQKVRRTEEPTVDQMAEAWLRYISDPYKYGSLTAQVMISLTGQEAAITKIFHDGMRFGYIQRQLDEQGDSA